MINFSLRELKFSRNMYFSYNERLALAKVEKDLSLQSNDKKKTLLSYIWFSRKVFSRIIILSYSFLNISLGYSITILRIKNEIKSKNT